MSQVDAVAVDLVKHTIQEVANVNYHDNQEPINNPIGTRLEMGSRRPRIRGRAPRWFTTLVFALFIGIILAFLLLG